MAVQRRRMLMPGMDQGVMSGQGQPPERPQTPWSDPLSGGAGVQGGGVSPLTGQAQPPQPAAPPTPMNAPQVQPPSAATIGPPTPQTAGPFLGPQGAMGDAGGSQGQPPVLPVRYAPLAPSVPGLQAGQAGVTSSPFGGGPMAAGPQMGQPLAAPTLLKLLRLLDQR